MFAIVVPVSISKCVYVSVCACVYTLLTGDIVLC